MSRSTEGWIQKRTRKLKSGKESVKYIGRIKPPGMDEIYSTPFDKKGRSDEPGTAAYWLAEQRELLRAGTLADPRARNWTLYEWSKYWCEGRGISDNTGRLYDAMTRIDLQHTELGQMPISKIQPKDIAAWMIAMRDHRDWSADGNLAPSTVNVRRAMLSAVFTGACAEKLRPDNPVKWVKRLRAERRIEAIDPNDIPTKATIWKWYEIAAEIRPYLQEALLTAAGTGMRPGELFGMEASQLTRGQRGAITGIWVSRQLHLGMPGITFGPPKTENSYRRIPVGKQVSDAIHRHLERYPLDPENPHGSIIFRNTRGNPWSSSSFSDNWIAIRDAAQTPDAIWYRLRHYYISGLIEGGASPKVVMERAGHSSPAYTLTRYARLWPDADETTARLSDRVLERDIDGTPDPA